jgi:formylglycine-generating enzyme required for sulfatase activity
MQVVEPEVVGQLLAHSMRSHLAVTDEPGQFVERHARRKVRPRCERFAAAGVLSLGSRRQPGVDGEEDEYRFVPGHGLGRKKGTAAEPRAVRVSSLQPCYGSSDIACNVALPRHPLEEAVESQRLHELHCRRLPSHSLDGQSLQGLDDQTERFLIFQEFTVRGGAWDTRAANLRAAYRDGGPPEDRADMVGLRATRSPG